MIGKETLELLKEALSESSYTVAVCGSGMLEEGGILGLKQEGRACEIEQEYGQSPEELFHISCFSRRPELFYDFYRRGKDTKDDPVRGGADRDGKAGDAPVYCDHQHLRPAQVR